MKRPLAWHLDCLRNMQKTWEQAKEAEIRARMEVIRLSNELGFRNRQIIEAQKKGMDGFDGDKFMAKERPTPSEATLREIAGG